MKAVDLIRVTGCDFFTGVPDSQLKALCDYLTDMYGISEKHIIAANEGNAAALAAGHYMATGRPPLVYMQNSGIGNIINPVASLLNDKVYAIPCVFVVGWRGEPGVKDEPQHIFQGEVTLTLLRDMDIDVFVISPETTAEEAASFMESSRERLAAGKSIAFVVRKGALTYEGKPSYDNAYTMKREQIIKRITETAGDDVIVSTTGKASRELFEIREAANDIHSRDFLTVGSMGHSSSVALAVALEKPHTRVWCIDGDGAALMHMGAMAVIGANKPANLVHVVINNGAHETVGGMPTVAGTVDLRKIAEGCGYESVMFAEDEKTLQEALIKAKTEDCLTFIEVRAAIGSRSDLGRPTLTAKENIMNFMNYLKEKD